VLTAVDSALMVIDAANGVEAQTRRLIEVCRQRDTPIITFVNKMDREVRDPLDILDEVERELGMPCVPMTWPVGQGKSFGGIINLRTRAMSVFESPAPSAVRKTLRPYPLPTPKNSPDASALKLTTRSKAWSWPLAPRPLSTKRHFWPANRRPFSLAPASTISV
jgi:peptide subunit release factor RF-3